MRLFHHLQCGLVGDNATLSGGWPQIPSPLSPHLGPRTPPDAPEPDLPVKPWPQLCALLLYSGLACRPP